GVILFFFFSSRRRHTRWPRDWSSDVCSSDLTRVSPSGWRKESSGRFLPPARRRHPRLPLRGGDGRPNPRHGKDRLRRPQPDEGQIGRASCRERGTEPAERGTVKEKRRKKSAR